MADGRSLIAALALGAEGINMGTRFIATREAPVHENVKQALVQATELDTRLIMRSLRNTERVLRNSAVDKVVAVEKEKGTALRIDDIREYVAGAYPRVMQQGDLEAGAWSCGLVAGLVHDVPSCRELIERIMGEAESIIATRLEGMRAG
jgi:nitronate monooxygenase